MKRKLPTFHKSRVSQVIIVLLSTDRKLAPCLPGCLEFFFRILLFRRFPLPCKQLIHVLEWGGEGRRRESTEERAPSILLSLARVALPIGRATTEICFNQSEALPKSRKLHFISMEFLRPFLRCHFVLS